MLVAGVWKVHLKLQFDAQAAESAAAADVAAAACAAATTSMHMDDYETAAAAAPANAAEGNMAQAKAITRIIDDPSITAAENSKRYLQSSIAGPPTHCGEPFQI
ncbi:TPA: hypothetical protein ACH3X1_001224 [Trebouxia sp. C0004]